jgi:hypothetical protein
VQPALDHLGVRNGEHGAILVSSEGSALRDAIVNGAVTLASNPAGCE